MGAAQGRGLVSSPAGRVWGTRSPGAGRVELGVGGHRDGLGPCLSSGPVPGEGCTSGGQTRRTVRPPHRERLTTQVPRARCAGAGSACPLAVVPFPTAAGPLLLPCPPTHIPSWATLMVTTQAESRGLDRPEQPGFRGQLYCPVWLEILPTPGCSLGCHQGAWGGATTALGAVGTQGFDLDAGFPGAGSGCQKPDSGLSWPGQPGGAAIWAV